MSIKWEKHAVCMLAAILGTHVMDMGWTVCVTNVEVKINRVVSFRQCMEREMLDHPMRKLRVSCQYGNNILLAC